MPAKRTLDTHGIIHHVHINELNGDSYRLKHSANRKSTTVRADQNKASADSRPTD